MVIWELAARRTLWILYIFLYATNVSVTSTSIYSFHLEEELPPGTVVGTINVVQGETYNIDGTPALFVIDSQTGIITTTSRIDRES